MLQRKSFTPFFLAVIFSFIIQTSSWADDPGITKVRLIQLSDSTYVLEADVPQVLLSSITQPVFPDRFSMSDLSYTNESGWITLRLMYKTSGPPLSSADELLLQWNRNGVDMTAQWLDGSTYKAMFNRSLGGIHIPIGELMTVERLTTDILKEGFLLGINHFSFNGIHLLFVLLIVLSFPTTQSLKFLLWYSSGHYLAMVIFETGLSGFDLLQVDLLTILFSLLLSYYLIYEKKIQYLGLLLGIIGVSHGLSYVHEIGDLGLNKIQMVQTMFSFNLAIDLGHYLVAAFLILLLKWFGWEGLKKRWVPIMTGGIAVFLILLVFKENVLSGNQKILALDNQYTPIIRVPQSNSGGRQIQRGTGLMNTPIVTYLSVEPYEVRQEILLQANSFLDILDRTSDFEDEISIDYQEGIKEALEDSVALNTRVDIDGMRSDPAEIRTHFVILNRGGVSSRQVPVPEKIDRAIIGITLIYDIEAYPDTISVDWTLFPTTSQQIEASAVDPHGASTFMISESDNQFSWKNRLAGYKVPEIKIIEIQRPAIPILSLAIWLSFILILGYRLLIKKNEPGKVSLAVTFSMIVISFVSYPLMRVEMKLPFLPEGKPNMESANQIMKDLLTNVYLAFDRRNEDQVYDRLSLTVTGDQLADIYMQNRQSMAMESRGGARAKVDEVNIEEIHAVNRNDQEGFVADVLWTVRGSVNHFGHTHYRQNQYRALVSFMDIEDTWKISNIETLDERRLY
jgi:hypothetical protein